MSKKIKEKNKKEIIVETKKARRDFFMVHSFSLLL